VQFETIGVLADLREVDAEQSGILKVACLGGHRFEIGEPRRQADGLWLADATTLDDDDRVVPTPEFAPTVQALSRAIESLQTQGHRPFLEPYRLNDTGWVANRWCEILPIPLAARQKLMELGEPQRRLRLVADFLRGRGVV
jgi:Lon protease-like protein